MCDIIHLEAFIDVAAMSYDKYDRTNDIGKMDAVEMDSVRVVQRSKAQSTWPCQGIHGITFYNFRIKNRLESFFSFLGRAANMKF